MANTRGLGFLQVITGSVKTKTYGFAAFTLFVVIILLVGAIRPTVLTITRINKEINDKRFINEQLDTKISSLASLGNQYSSISTQVQDLPLIFPAEGNFSLFMANIEEISKSLGYTLNGITFGKVDNSTQQLAALAPFSARLNITGQRANLIKLLEAYESMPMFPTVKQISFAKNTNDSGLTNFSVELVIYQVEDPEFFD